MHIIRLSVTENRLSDPTLLGLADYEPYISEIGESWVIETPSGIVGFASIDWSKASVWALFVHPDQEGRGFGKMLIECLQECALERGLSSINLVTTPGTRAEAFYQRNGWRAVGIEPNGEVLMALALEMPSANHGDST
jgi:GNAT superfamily N-acetyltransferase